MKHFVFFFCVLFCLKTSAQSRDEIFFNSDFEIVDEVSLATYQGHKDGKNVKAYRSSGEIVMLGKYNSKNEKNGHFVYYSENGSKQSEGCYKKNLLEGEWINWFKDGSIDNRGFYNKGKRDGKWQWYFPNGQISCSEIYSKGNRVEANCWNVDGSISLDSLNWNQLPRLSISNDSLLNFVLENINYPVDAELKKIEGIVRVRYLVEKDGKITTIKITESLHPDIDNEAIRIVRMFPNYMPGKMHNRPIKAYFNLPITFSLEESN